MIPPFDPTTYPGPRPAGPVLVHRSTAVPLDVDPAADPPVRVDGDAPVLDPGSVRWVVAYGANACPGRLVSKGLDRRGALLLPARLRGWVPAFEARRTGYGAVPLTLVRDPGASAPTWVLGLHVADTPRLDASEGRRPGRTGDPSRPGAAEPDDLLRAPPDAYRLGHVGEVVVADVLVLDDALAYLPGPRTRVQRTDDGWHTCPPATQVDAVAHLEAGHRTAVPPLVPSVEGPWPTSRLRPRSPSAGQAGAGPPAGGAYPGKRSVNPS